MIALPSGRLPYKVTNDPIVTPLRELIYLPKGVMEPHDLPADAPRAGAFPEDLARRRKRKC